MVAYIMRVSIEWAARHSHRRAEEYEHAGFVYDRQMDLWACPAGERLLQTEIDHKLRVMRYRAPAKTYTACSLKSNCTDSDEGREIERRLDSWIGSEQHRFHRGLSLTLHLLAALILVAEMLRHDSRMEMAILLSLLALNGIAGVDLLKEFFGPKEGT